MSVAIDTEANVLHVVVLDSEGEVLDQPMKMRQLQEVKVGAQ
jgi:hypothetical protein